MILWHGRHFHGEKKEKITKGYIKDFISSLTIPPVSSSKITQISQAIAVISFLHQETACRPKLVSERFIIHQAYIHQGSDQMQEKETPADSPVLEKNSTSPPPQESHGPFKSNNPFNHGSLKTEDWPTPVAGSEVAPSGKDAVQQYKGTSISPESLMRYPFKTSNRILEDLKLTPPLFEHMASNPELTSLLNSKPITYSRFMLSVLANEDSRTLVLNNAVKFIEPVSKVNVEDKDVTVTAIRGLIVSKNLLNVRHFKVHIVEKTLRSPFPLVDKHEYHVIPKNLISDDDLELLGGKSALLERIMDDAFFMSLNSSLNHILRVLVYDSEFSLADLSPLMDESEIEARYLKSIANDLDSEMDPENVPNSLLCFHALLKVLENSILSDSDIVHTISEISPSLDIVTQLTLFDKLGLTRDDDDRLVSPNLSSDPSLKESYIRKAYELIFIGKHLKTSKTNDMDVTYSFSDNLSQVHSALAEVDKHSALQLGRTDRCNKLSFFINLSCCTFYQDELVIRCFENTVKSDPMNKMVYVDSFKTVMAYRSSRNSSRLLSYYNSQYAKGLMYGESDLVALLKAIGIEGVESPTNIDPESIIEMYKTSYQADQKNYTYFNKQLQIIGAILNSSRILEFIADELIPTQIALEEIRIEEVTEDEVVVTAFEFKLDEVMQSSNFDANNPDVIFLQKCLLSIAVGRKSYILMNYIEKKLPGLQRKLHISLADALRILEVQSSAKEFEVISNFQTKLSESSLGNDVDIRTLREAFRVIAEEKKSEIMFSFLQQGKIDSSLLPPENWPTGLDNIGNTCYLNSLLQYYFCIKPLRNTILEFDHNANAVHKKRKIGGRFVEDSELERSAQFMYRLQALFDEMITTRKRCVQPSKELAYLSFLPLSQPVSFKTEPDVEASDVTNDKENAIVIRSKSPELVHMHVEDDMEDLIEIDHANHETGEKGDLDLDEGDKNGDTDAEKVSIAEQEPEKEKEQKLLAINADQMESTIEVGRQQDVTECIENVTFQIETALEPERIEDDGEQYDLIKRLFSGKTKQTITPLDLSSSQKPRSSLERFFSLIINVGDHPKDIYDALDNYFSEDVVNLEEGAVKKSQTIAELPQVLQFHIQRVLFDRERLIPYKSLEVIPFSEKIYLDRYLETDDPEIKAKRQEVFEWKSQMRSLYAEKDEILNVDPDTKLSVVDALKATLKYLESKVVGNTHLSIRQETLDAISYQITELKTRLQVIHDQLETLQSKVSSQFSSYQKTGYSLFAIFIHRGEASFGHYWVYIKDPHRNIYRKYNDDNVTEVPASEVLNFTESNTATPYYVVYVKDELEQDYVEPLRREIAG